MLLENLQYRFVGQIILNFCIFPFFSLIPTFHFFLHVPFCLLLKYGNDVTEINLEDHSWRNFLNLKSQSF